MTEARKLDLQAEQLPSDLPPLPKLVAVRTAPEPSVVPSGPPRRSSRAPEALSRATRTAFIFFVIGGVAFTGGVAMACAIVSGSLDLTTGWVKAALGILKQLVRTASA